jgi:retron-type reverse transcriptase
MSTAPKPLGKATYVATTLEREWLQIEQRKLYARSRDDRSYVFCKLWGLITDPRNLSVAFARVAANRGRRTAGVDKITVHQIMTRGTDVFLVGLRSELRTGRYRPRPVRRVLIPKSSHPGKFRPLGIPTVERSGRAGRSEEHPGADLRGGLLSVLVWFSPG